MSDTPECECPECGGPKPNECGGYYCSEEHGHIDCQKGTERVKAIACKSPGLTMDGITLTEVNSCNGQHYWKAVQPIGSIFGHEVEGEISAIGSTKEQAIEHLTKERNNLYESIWA